MKSSGFQATKEVEIAKDDKKKAEIELAQLEFGLELARIRESKHLTQKRLHEITRIDRTVISELERGIYPPSLPLIKTLSEGLGINPHILVAAYYDIPLPEFNVDDRETLDSLIKIALDYASRQGKHQPPLPLTDNKTPISPKGERNLENYKAERRTRKKVDNPAEDNN